MSDFFPLKENAPTKNAFYQVRWKTLFSVFQENFSKNKFEKVYIYFFASTTRLRFDDFGRFCNFQQFSSVTFNCAISTSFPRKASDKTICKCNIETGDVFVQFEHQVCPSYQRYCMNYSNALSYMEHQLRGNIQWELFVRHCERDSRCKRLKLTDLLVAPMQHLTKYPLLLKTIRKKTFDHRERKLLQDAISNVEAAISEHIE